MISKKCPNCGFENPETAKFCNECGGKLAPTESPPLKDQTPGQVTPPHKPPEAAEAEPEGAPPEQDSQQAEVPAEPPSAQLKEAAAAEETSSEAGPILLAPSSALVASDSAATPQEAPPGPPVAPSEPEAPEPEGPAEEEVAEEPRLAAPFGERFKILEELGTGTLGTVYKVLDKAMERELALKSIKPEIAENREVFERFSQELKAERGIVHKNIARIFELNALLETPFITMEYVPGQDLKSLIREKKRLPAAEALSLAKQLFNGLSEAHRQGTLHLDLRPDNIVLDKEGTVKIMDLGISRLFRSKGITRGIAGMPQYMSPEQVEGQEADARSDIYAAGAIFYEMLTGSLPPVGQSPRSPKELNPSIPSDLSLLVLKCLAQDKEARYRTAMAVRDELGQMEEAVSQISVEPPAPPPEKEPSVPPLKEEPEPVPQEAAEVSLPPLEQSERKRKPWKGLPIPRRALFPVLLAAAVLAVVVFLWLVVFKTAEGPAPAAVETPRISLAVIPFEDADPAREKEYLGQALAEEMIQSLKKTEGIFLPDKESSFSFRGISRGSRIIGRRLQVDYYLGGNLRVSDNAFRIEAELIKVETGTILWSGQYEREQEALPAIAEEIGRAVVQNFGLTWSSAQLLPAEASPHPAFEAFDSYAQGRWLAENGEQANLEKALENLDKAVTREPAFAIAFEALADVYLRLANGRYWPPEKALPKAKDAALKALLINPRLPEAQVALARVKMIYDWDFAGAERGYQEALKIDPDCSPAHQSYALLLSALGRHREAIDEITAAQGLNPQSAAVNAQAALALYFSRLYDQANAEIRKGQATDPSYFGHYYNSALLQIQMEQYAEALLSLKKAGELGADPLETELLRGHIYARQGNRREVGRILTAALKAAKENKAQQVSIASVYAGLGDKEQVIACLEIAHGKRESGLLFLKVHPLFDLIRADSRYLRLLQRIGLGN